MTIEDLKKYFKVKTGRDLARKIGKSEPLMTVWGKHGIPYEQQCVFYFESKHKLKVDKSAKKGSDK